MPIYEFQCDSCHKVFEVTLKISDPPLTKCPECAGPVRKLVSRSSFQLKGTGWYVTDYKKRDSAAPSRSKNNGNKSASTEETKPAGETKKPDPSSGTKT